MDLKIFSVLLIYMGCCYGLFVPEQLPTLLSFIYTNIPPIRKGHDSRVGFGFRLGPNADFQVLLELGPQMNTQPLGPDGGAPEATGNKREVLTGKLDKTKDWEDMMLLQQNNVNTGPSPEVHADIVNHLRQLYKPQKVDQNTSEKQ